MPALTLLLSVPAAAAAAAIDRASVVRRHTVTFTHGRQVGSGQPISATATEFNALTVGVHILAHARVDVHEFSDSVRIIFKLCAVLAGGQRRLRFLRPLLPRHGLILEQPQPHPVL